MSCLIDILTRLKEGFWVRGIDKKDRQFFPICYSNTMSNSILYEQPLNERIRVFLRLEHFFNQMSHFQQGATAQDTQASVTSLIEILNILERNDVRTDILKEVDRQIAALSRLMDTPAVDASRLQLILEKLSVSSIALQKCPSKLSYDMRDNELLTSIRQRAAISAGTCSFDLPAYHYLLSQPTMSRANLVHRWMNELTPLKEGIHLLLSLLRNSSEFEPQLAEEGFFQKSLDAQTPCQLLRIRIPANEPVYPEVSGNKHRVNVRFLGFSENGRARQVSGNQDFSISFCSI